MTNYSKKEIAVLFSDGHFELAFPHLSEDIIWEIIGDHLLHGKSAVVTHCKKITEYFESVQTDFKTVDIIETERKIVIRGTGEFISDGKSVNLIAACDIYEFNSHSKLVKISSYCIPENK
ncbi:MAG: hypothetical protein AAGI23_22260 [Bacteroidota bacterium]